MTTDAELAQLVADFEACTLPKARWTHAAHLSVALWHLRRRSPAATLTHLRQAIQRYNGSIGGNPDGYHETITRAWVTLIAGFIARVPVDQSDAALTAALLRECGRSDYLLRYYAQETLTSDAARRGWVPPDRAPFDPSCPDLSSEPRTHAKGEPWG